MDIDRVLNNLENAGGAIEYEMANEEAIAAINHLRQQLAEQTSSEPVAWLVDGRIEQGLSFDHESAQIMADANCGNIKPLYTTPPSVEVLLEALREIADMTYDHWSNGAKAGQIATVALSSYKPTEG